MGVNVTEWVRFVVAPFFSEYIYGEKEYIPGELRHSLLGVSHNF